MRKSKDCHHQEASMPWHAASYSFFPEHLLGHKTKTLAARFKVADSISAPITRKPALSQTDNVSRFWLLPHCYLSLSPCHSQTSLKPVHLASLARLCPKTTASCQTAPTDRSDPSALSALWRRLWLLIKWWSVTTDAKTLSTTSCP